ncbi:uncharacterized protein LOC130669842 isoform X2 [Microplitis mediator]|uniref:uncharacterized protein LOC130669842 isoform X2 n=1 Tax=Microplitis mediator TaxID=375433 RepID=UPI0025550918|nr:uncharacterized protein LOC130669842 isoform X2 [Microplitis mediator]
MKLPLLLTVFITTIVVVFSSNLQVFRQQITINDHYNYYLRYETKKMLCISDNPMDAIIWNDVLDNNTQREDDNILPESIVNQELKDKCKISMYDFKCFSQWINNSKWEVVYSFRNPMGPVFDIRWENFPEYSKLSDSDTDYHPVEFYRDDSPYYTILRKNGALVVSIRGSANAQFLLCEDKDYEHNFCYWLIIGGWNNTITGIRECRKGIPLENSAIYPDCRILRASITQHSPLSAFEWKTFIIIWDKETQSINLFNPHELILSYTISNSTIENFLVFYGNPNPSYKMLYRFHQYQYVLSTDLDTKLISPPLSTDYFSEFCVDMLIGLCADCQLIVKLIDSNNTQILTETFSSATVRQKVDHKLPMWQYVRFNVSNVDGFQNPFSLEIITNSTKISSIDQHHWAIANISECLTSKSTDLEHQISMTLSTQINSEYQNSDDINNSDDVWPNITCQKFSYNEPQVLTVDSQNLIPIDNLHLCPESRIGPHCMTDCNEYFDDDCSFVSICDKHSCYCIQGHEGQKCNSSCQNGFYGYGCQKHCGNCALTSPTICNFYDGRCIDGCIDLPDVFYLPPYCTIAVEARAPTINFINETSVQVTLSEINEYDDVALLIIFEIESNLEKEKRQSIVVSDELINVKNTMTKDYFMFNNLNAGESYSIRTLMTLEYNINQHKLLESPWKSFTTLCNWDKKFTIEPNTTSLSIKRIYEERIYSCPDNWYTVKLEMISINNESTLIATNHMPETFPILLNNLQPYTYYNVCINSVDAKFNNCQVVQTLEAEPSAVVNLHCKNVNTSVAEIEWLPPNFPKGKILGYNLKINVLYYLGCTKNYLDSPQHLLPSRSFIISEKSLSSQITDLIPYVLYDVEVEAFNSKLGDSVRIEFETKENEIPSETFDDLKFKNNVITWSNPADCSTITGHIWGARIFITGLSEYVQHYSTRYDISEYSFNLHNENLYGAENFKIRIHVIHSPNGIHNETAYSELTFITDPRPPPKVENFEIVQVNQQDKTLTLRWQEPVPPHNGEIIYYGIRFSDSYIQTTDLFYVYPNETCQLWNDSLCKRVAQPFGKREFIEIRAYNKGVREPGDVNRIEYQREEQAPYAPGIISIKEMEKGVVELKWKHPLITGGPLKKFIIKEEILSTLLENESVFNNSIKEVEFPVYEYQTDYSTQLYLFSSSYYKISIQAMTNIIPGLITSVEITTSCTLAFESEPRISENKENLTIDLIVPPIVNSTHGSMLYIIIKSTTSLCDNITKLDDILEQNIKLEYNENAWLAGSFLAHNIANRSFTIGDNRTYNNITNCLLCGGDSYVIIILLCEQENICSKKGDLVTWESHPIEMKKKIKLLSHMFWTIPLSILIIISVSGLIYYYYKRKRYQRQVVSEADFSSAYFTNEKLFQNEETNNVLEKEETVSLTSTNI